MKNIISLVDEKDYAAVMQGEVEPYLAGIRTEGYFSSYDGKNIHYEAHTIDNAKGNVVIVHGFTEFAEKFREMAYYFVKNGYNAFALDNRGHGHSYRMHGSTETVRLNKFSDYVEDLDVFVKKIVKPQADNLPMYIYSHSMGGGIAARYIQVHNDVFKKAILSSPMICAQTGAPVPLAKTTLAVVSSLGLKNISVPGMCKFNPDATYENSSDTCKERFEYFMSKRRSNAVYRTAGPSFGWVNEALKLTDHLLDDNNCKNVTAKVLIFQPERDNKVISSYQNTFAGKLSDAQLVFVPGSKHEIFGTTNDVLKGYLDSIFEFLG
ncbi:MAG: alpha/beta hydrolase [Clostridia bacterium]|nr:alpha/beta hydrolase [Clostridia bacterium]